MRSYFEKANAQPIGNLSPTAASYIVGKALTDILPLPLVIFPEDTGIDSKSSVKTNHLFLQYYAFIRAFGNAVERKSTMETACTVCKSTPGGGHEK